MKVVKSLIVVSILSVLVSCASTDAPVADKAETKTVAPVEQEKVKESKEPKETKEEINFINSLSNTTIEIKNKLPETTVGTAFASSFSVVVKNNEAAPVSGMSITVKYPAGKDKGTVKYESTEVTTDENGIASFVPPVTDCSLRDYIYAYPTPVNGKDKYVNAAKEKEVKSEFKVKSLFYKKGILLYIYEYDERGKPKNNFYNVLGEIRTLGGRNVGNAPLNDTKLIDAEPKAIIEEIKGFEYINVEKFDFLIVGTVKFTKQTTKVDGGYSCAMIADMYAVSLKTGEILYKEVYEEEGFGKNWGQDQTDCKSKLGKKIINDLLYSL